MPMPRSFKPNQKKLSASSFYKFYQPVVRIFPQVPVLSARGDRPLQMTFEDQLKALIFFHLEEHVSARHMLQVLEQDAFAAQHIAPENGISRSSFSEAVNSRGLEQLKFIFEALSRNASGILPKPFRKFGDLVAIDGSLINATLSMFWADYRKASNKAKLHLGFNLNQGIPSKIFFTAGNGAERPFVSQLIAPGQTVVADRGYQEHALFDSLQDEGKSFVIRIKANTTKTVVEQYDFKSGGIVFFDALVQLGTDQNNNKTKKPVRLVGYRVAGVDYWVATDRKDLSAEQIAEIYKLRWHIENFFAWWKRHLKVYHLIARSQYGLMVQILAGLITYLLLAIYCHENHGEKVSIKRVRELRLQIQNELRESEAFLVQQITKERNYQRLFAIT
jgi:hypothetical protein